MSKQTWRIDLLGGLRAQCGDRIVTRFETRRSGALLALLALNLNRRLQRETVAEQLWPDEDWDAIRNRLRQTLSSLRRDLDPDSTLGTNFLQADRIEVWLDAKGVDTDIVLFETALRSASFADAPVERLPLLRTAIELYRGEFLEGYFDDWILVERGRLAEVYRDALGRYAAALSETGETLLAIEAARKAVATDTLREDAHCDLMRYYAAAGRKSEALRQYREMESILRDEIGATPSPESRALMEQLRAGLTTATVGVPGLSVSEIKAPVSALESEGGSVPLESQFYVVRPADAQFDEALARRDSIVLLKGSHQMGKTSLLARGLQHAREAGFQVVLTDLQKVTEDQMQSADALFYALADSLVEQLELDLKLAAFWQPERGWNVNLERFLRREILGQFGAPVVWALDEVDRLFGHPFTTEVFGLFRSWHNARSLDPAGPWRQLTLAMAYATEAHLFITNLNQSPFNVGTRLTLEDFVLGEVAELNRRYESPLADDAQVGRFFSLAGGHPYLVRRGLRELADTGMKITEFESRATRDDGFYGDHLRRMAASLRRDADLLEIVRAMLRGEPCSTPDGFYRLHSAGVLGGADVRQARFRCRLYELYLAEHMV